MPVEYRLLKTRPTGKGKMKEIFIIWITVQLMFIGMALSEAKNEMVRQEYDCQKQYNEHPVVYGAMFPLVYFVDDSYREIVKSYCMEK